MVNAKVLAVATVGLLSTGVSAQLPDLGRLGLSATCLGGAAPLLLGDLGTCLDLVGGLLPLVQGDGSIVEPLDGYLNKICTSEPCKEDTLKNADSTLSDKCKEDLDGGNSIALALRTIIQKYPAVREAGCLEDKNNNTRCITSTLNSVQSATGNDINTQFLFGILGGGNGTSALSQLPEQVLCTNCTKAIAQVIKKADPSAAEGGLGQALQGKCGDNFASGELPAGIENPVAASATNGSEATPASSSPAASTSGAALSEHAFTSTSTPALIASVLGLGVVAGVFGVLA